jgi:peptide/bleomycin uptake transporter
LFHTFFPKPKLLLLSAIVWGAIVIAFWYGYWKWFGAHLGFPPMDEENKPVGLSYFITPDARWYYSYFIVTLVAFCTFWQFYGRQCEWRGWSIWGTAFILLIINFNVDVSLALNRWRRPFYDLVQQALSKPHVSTVKPSEFYDLILVFFQIASVYIVVITILLFFISHYVFRWRTAMSNYYTSLWPRVRHIEGASQRVQEDTRDFANYLEDLGTSFINSFMTLIAFLPLLYQLEAYVKEWPFVGEVWHPLILASILWSVFGTLLLWLFGIRLPGLEFQNQRVEAAFRKELVYGEDHHDRAQPPTVRELYSNVRRSYFRLYANYLYFNVARYLYIQTDAIFISFLLVPSLSAAVFTFGIMQQITSAFGEVSNSFQYLINSWTDIIKLISVQKRLKAFEAQIRDEPLPSLDQKFIEAQQSDVDPDATGTV